ncbi:restriction endonuclease subunit S [Bacteroides fragilis]|nr:restriction endonuclease subunit S [Bacteroides fragilis]
MNSLNSYYEKFIATGEVKCIDEEIPFEIPNGWEWERVGNIFFVTKLAGFEYTKFFTKEAISAFNPIPIVRAQNVRMGFFEENKNEAISEMLSNQLKRSALNKKCLLMTFIGAGIGDTCIFPAERKNHLAPNVAKIEPLDDSIFLDYAVFALMSPCGQRGVNAIKKSTAQPSLSMETIRKLLIPIPPFKEQKCISLKLSEVLPLVEKYSKVQKVQNQINDEINILLSKSILQEAIRGKLVPQIAEEGTADKLLAEIHKEKERLVKEGKLKKAILTDSVIYKGDDNKYYEQVGKKCLDITEQIPFETPKNWVWTRLSHIANIYTGNSISETEKKSKFTDVIGRYYIGTKDVDFYNRIIYDNGIAIPKQYEPDFRLAPNNSILMCIEGGSAGRKIAILNQDVCFGNKLCCFSPFVGTGKYMYYYLQSPSFFELFNLNKTGIIGGVSIAKVKEILIPLPPIKEQQRIVAQIEKLFEQLR